MRGRGIASALAGLLLLAVAQPAWGQGIIAGRLVNRTPGGQSVEGVEVVLAREEGAGEQAERRTRTGQQGRFRFEGVPADANLRYRLTIRYQGAEYTAVSPAGDGTKDLVIPVWDGSSDPGRLRVARHHIVVEAVEGALRIQEVMVVRNEGDRTFVGGRPVSGDRRATLQFTLPPGFAELRYEDGLMECCVVPAEHGFVDTMDVKPGVREVTFAYQIRPGGDAHALQRPVDYPTGEVDVFVTPAILQVSATRLTDRGTVSGQGKEYRRWGSAGLERGALLTLNLAGLPRPGFPWKWVAYAAVAAILAVGLAYPMIRCRRKPAARRAAAGSPPRLDLELRRVELVAALAALDEWHEAGQVPEAEYQQRRVARKATLAEVLRALEGERAGAG